MPGDFTRFTFDPFEDHIGVRMQQGRVLLDADFNELVEIRDRRSRAGTLDTLGPAVVPAETPHGFEIVLAGPSVTIGVGRMYVDGQLAENHGLAPREWERRLAEERGTLPVPYEQQPYFPNVAVEAPFPAAGGPHLVYLDVWQRELTHLEDSDLLEKALGVDSATRLQTVWQVKVLPNINASCATPDGQIPAWVAATAPSAGRLNTAAVGVPTSNDPCIVNPTGGYRGTENRLYRVEVHRGGPLGTATFKWSRDNGSVGAAVTAINAGRDRLTVSRTRRDAVLRFSANDWVEVTDDWRELAGKPGLMAKVLSVDDVNQTLTLTAALPAGVFDLAAPGSRHTRVRRWDQKGLVLDALNNVVANVDTGLGEIPVNAAASLVLEDGVQVSFSVAPAGGSFKVGDFWVVAARTVDASVEILNQAPPRGIHHHYARLAMVTFPATVEDCRVKWPNFGRSCCTRVVFPGESIQAAIDSLPPAGGCVCLKVGVHTITQTIRITGRDIHFHGESTGAVVETSAPIPLLDVLGAQDIVVESLGFRVLSKSPYLLAVGKSQGVSVVDCQLRSVQSSAAYAALIAGSEAVRFERVETSGSEVGILAAKRSRQVEILACELEGRVLQEVDAGFCGVWLDDVEGGTAEGLSRVESNRIQGFARGIAVNDDLLAPIPISDAFGTVVAGNHLVRRQALASETQKYWGIDVAADSCQVRDNVLFYLGENYGGIRLSGSRGAVVGNRLSTVSRDQSSNLPLAILVGIEEQDSVGFGDHALVAGNFVSGGQDGIFVNGAFGFTLENNDLGGEQGRLRAGILVLRGDHGKVEGNRIEAAENGLIVGGGSQNLLLGNRLRQCEVGVFAIVERDLTASENHLETCLREGFAGLLTTGATRLAGNRFHSCGFESPAAVYVVSLASAPEALVAVESCELLDCGVSASGAPSATAALGLLVWANNASIRGNRLAYTAPEKLDPTLEHRAMLLLGALASVSPDQILAVGSALVLDNQINGPGLSALVQVLAQPAQQRGTGYLFDRVTFSQNVCEHHAAVPASGAARLGTVALAGNRLIVVGNHVRAARGFASFDFGFSPLATFVANHHSGPVLRFSVVRPANPNANDFNFLG